MGADLSYTCVGPNQFQITLALYRDCTGILPSSSYTIYATSASCGQSLSFTASQVGSAVEVSPLCPADLVNSACNGGSLPGVEQYNFTGTINLPAACTDWVFSFREGNRNIAITTVSAPDLTYLYVEATLNNVAAPCNNSPVFSNLPVPYVCLGQPYIYNHGAIDPDGDSLVYTLIDALDDAGTPLPYLGGFSGTNPMTSVPATSINSSNGNVNMTPTLAGEVAVMAVLVEEYRNGVLIGSTIRDIQVTVLTCTNNNPNVNPVTSVSGGTATGSYTVETCPGNNLSFDIPGIDADVGDVLTMAWNSGIPGGSFSTAGNATGTFTWTPGPGDIGSHFFTVGLADDACPVYGSQTVAIEVIVLDRTTAGPDQVYCTSGDPVQLNASGGSTFNWNVLSGGPGNMSCNPCDNPEVTPPVTTVYEVISNLSGACINRDTVTVTLVPDFALGILPDSTICLGQSLDLLTTPIPGGSYTFDWSPAATLSSNTAQSPTATPTDSVRYYVEVESAAGCRIRDSIDVAVVDVNLSMAPTASPADLCAGDPVNLAANVSNGDCNVYSVSTITPSGTGGGGWTSVALGDDATSGALPIGFTFNFFCNDYTQFYIGSNGGITFSGDYIDTSPDNLPTASTPNNGVFLCWDDLDPGSGGTIRYKTIGTAPNRTLIVHFSNVEFYFSTNVVNGQIKLYETSNIIELHVGAVEESGVHTMGIENSDGTVGYAPAGYNNTTYTINSNMAWRFSPQAGTPYTVTWQAPLGSPLGTGDTYSDSPTADMTYYAVLQDQAGVCAEIIAPLAVTVTSVDAGPSSAICIGDSAALNASFSGPVPSGAPAVCGTSAGCDGSGGSGSGDSGSGTSYTGTGTPYEGFWHDGRVQYLYRASELNAAGINGGTINSIGWNVDNKGSSQAYSNFRIRISCVGVSDLSSATWQPAGTLVYGPASVTTSTGWNLYTLTTPYDWDGVSNLLVEVCFDNGSYTGDDDVYYTTTGYTSVLYDYADYDAGCSLSFPSTSTSRPNTRFTMCYETGGVNYVWSPSTGLSDPGVEDPMASPAVPTWYYLTASNDACSVLDSVFVDVNCLLPVELISLEGKRVGETAELSWQTASETRSSHFTVQRQEPDMGYIDIGQVAAAGTSHEPREYRFTDFSPMTGKNTYRLMVVDFDGQSAPTNSVDVWFDDEAGLLSVHPNPSEGRFHFTFLPGSAAHAEITVYDLAGRVLYEEDYSGFNGGEYDAEVDLSGMADGVYLYELQLGNEKFFGKLNIAR